MPYKEWVINEARLLPEDIVIEFPHFKLSIDQTDREQLSLVNEPEKGINT